MSSAPAGQQSNAATDKLAGRIAIVTGAAAGYGAGIARRLAAEGAWVVVADLDGVGAAALVDDLNTAGQRALAVACDVTSGPSVAALMARVVEVWGGVDILVNNAGLGQKPARVGKTPEAEFDRLMAVNVKSHFHMAVFAVPVLRQRGGGNIINIASVSALRPRPGMTWYNATKSAVVSLTQSMAIELAPDHIRVNAVAPSAGRTALLETMLGERFDEGVAGVLETIPLRRMCTPADVAAAVVWLVSDEASFITGTVLPVDGGRSVA